MSVTIGRASLNDLYDLRVSGRRVSFATDIEGSDAYGLQALRQQLAGLVGNRDEEVVPFTWSEDATLDGFYRVVSVDIPSTEVQLSNGYIPGVRVELEQVAGLSSVWFELTSQSVVRTNSHGITTPSGIAYTRHNITNPAYDTRKLPGVGSEFTRRAASTSYNTSCGTATAPLTLGAFAYQTTPSLFYSDACKVEVLYGSTWYTVVGSEVQESRRWRISNGIVRLTSPNGATAGTLEVWDNGASAWESASVSHWDATSAMAIGFGWTGVANEQPTLRILRNSPEAVVVRLATASRDFTYSVKRGAMHVEAVYTSDSNNQMGVGYSSANACTAITGGIRRTSNDANGNRLVFGTTVTQTSDLVNGYVYPTTSAALTRTMFMGVELAGSGATSGNTAAELVDQFMAAQSWRQRVVVQ